MTKLTKRVSRPLAAATVITAATFGAFAVPTAASAHWSCGRAAPSDIDTSGNHYARRDQSVVARVGSSSRCAISARDIENYDNLDYHCYALDINGEGDRWTYVVTVGGAARGWVDHADLADNGSSRRCNGDT